jgi:hypothetical protein
MSNVLILPIWSCIIIAFLNFRGCLFRLLVAFQKNKPMNPNKQLALGAAFAEAKAANRQRERSTI